ncbi:MAG: YihY/virulence factor BrkB family protein [Gaiellaceae bacterium]
MLRDFTRYDLLTYSSAIAFQVLYAVVPLVMLGLAGIGLVGEQSLWRDEIAPALRRRLSPQAFTIADRTARHAMGGGRVAWATIGVAITLYGVAAALRAMMTPLNKVYGARETRSWGRRLLVSLGGGAIVTVCVLAAIIVVLGGRLVHPHNAVLQVGLFIGRWLVALALLMLANATLIRIVPAKKRPVRWISIGSTLATVCWIGGTLGFGAYISAISYASFYGPFAGIVLLLVYLHVSAIAFLLGVTVDAELRQQVSAKR